jgi:hypothetical protein
MQIGEGKNKLHQAVQGFRRRRAVLAACLLLLMLPAGSSFGTIAEEPPMESPSESIEDFTLSWVEEMPPYQREGRPDPFSPFISEKLLHAEVPVEDLTGMRRFEPGQLTLVSVVFTEKGSMAMVEDSVGRGYILREGSKIGRSGVVAQIIPNEVIIKQHMLTATGEPRVETVEMILRKEGEK